MSQNQRTYYFYGVSSLLSSWIMAVGSFIAILVASAFVDKLWLPAVVMIAEFLLLSQLNKDKKYDAGCCILLYTITRILFFVAIVMVAVNLYYMKFIDPNEYLNGTANRRIPYITILILAPTSTIVSFLIYVFRTRLSVCRLCRKKYGPSNERGFLGRIYETESKYQLRILFFVSLVISIYTTWYYWTHYSNVNLNRADHVYYLYLPLIIYGLTVLFLGRRYLRIFSFYQENVIGEAGDERDVTLLRFIIVCGDRIFMRDPEHSEGLEKIDSPIALKIDYTEKVPDFDALKRFCKAADMETSAVEMRFLYENINRDMHSNIFHYLCKVESHAAVHESKLKGEWLTLYQIRALRDAGMVKPLLSAEMERLYTVAMARKTYDKSGYRLYKMKHYTPSFKISDLTSLDVDYNDPKWLIIARENEDRPFFKLKKFVKKYFKGYEI